MTKLKIVNTTNIEIIKWNDAQADADWEEKKEPELAECITVGFLVSENRNAICIASTYSEPFYNAKIQRHKSWIMSRRKMSNKEFLAEPLKEKEENVYTNT